ncbi:SIR2 family NAD-dependent protein deacylase [Amycolatopsis suaedae]|uniref:protein acetyllysine N-acetyltransferase n=1 Tax=Amycolatopsis suaedae TaxID=2510978 RepID=A0A4Q7IYE0_9PSEU|nr:Sir2 family NAD-dependent protein deacetylase [Amycolatopsis suaedae]RZQ59272.1 NAD-dependent deacetylase [Amycolatopsis suaedae]
MTGAGISTDSGIPDFRGPNGVWTRDPKAERMSSLQSYVDSGQLRERVWQTRLTHPSWQARPNAGHHALVRLERAGRLRTTVTQNIDGLHQKAGADPDRVVELHGTLAESVCLSCGDRRDMREALDRVDGGEADPDCLVCGGILKSATISFGQALDPEVLARARAAAESCDLMLVAGSSLTVQPAAGLVGRAAAHGAAVIICNASPTPYDDVAEVVLRDPLSDVLPALIRTE